MKNYVMGRVDLRIRLKLPQEVIQDDLAAVVQLGEIFFLNSAIMFICLQFYIFILLTVSNDQF